MKLADYLKTHHLTHDEFSKKVGVARTQITRIINKKRNASPHLIKKIKEVTSGKVTFEDLFNPEAPTRLKSMENKDNENS
jgi:plasmid maintenance system antidote protein VapI